MYLFYFLAEKIQRTNGGFGGGGGPDPQQPPIPPTLAPHSDYSVIRGWESSK